MAFAVNSCKTHYIMSSENTELNSSLKNIKAYGQLLIENLRLVSTEKTTILLSSAALAAILGLIIVIAFFFVSMAVVLLLAKWMPLMYSSLAIGGFFLLMGLLLFLMRERIIVDPVARFMSRLFLEPPTDEPKPQETPEDNGQELLAPENKNDNN